MIEQTNIQTAPKRHSRLGIASIIIGLSLPVLLVVFIIIAAMTDAKKGTTGNDIIGVLFLIMLSFPFLHMLALIFGLIGTFSKKTKKLLPISGAVINGFLLLLVVVFIVFIIPQLGALTAFR
jgi:hypothetical protein